MDDSRFTEEEIFESGATILGTFADFLVKKGLAIDTIKNYVGVVKRILIDRCEHGRRRIESRISTIYKNLNAVIEAAEHQEESSDEELDAILVGDVDGSSRSDVVAKKRRKRVKVMTMEHYYFFMKFLFELNDAVAFTNRLYFTLTFNICGEYLNIYVCYMYYYI